jgi:hypothetical protein
MPAATLHFHSSPPPPHHPHPFVESPTTTPLSASASCVPIPWPLTHARDLLVPALRAKSMGPTFRACARLVMTLKTIVETRWWSMHPHVDSFCANKATWIYRARYITTP